MISAALTRQRGGIPDFRHETKFLLARWMKIHRSTCGSLPDEIGENYEPIASFADGIDRGGHACGVCLSEYYVKENSGMIPADEH